MKETCLFLFCTHCMATVCVVGQKEQLRFMKRKENLDTIIPCCDVPRFNWGSIEGRLLPFIEFDIKEDRFDTVIKNTHEPMVLIDTPNALIVNIENSNITISVL